MAVNRRRRRLPCRVHWLWLAALSVLLALGPAWGQEAEAPATEPTAIFAGSEAPASLADLRAMQERIQQVTQQAIPCTVGVRVGTAHGSGVIINPQGYVLTAAHVAGQPGLDATVILHDGRLLRGKTLGMNRSLDAGLVKLDGRRLDLPHALLGTSQQVKPGQWCLATGHPGGFEPGRRPVLRVGRVLSVNENSAITTDCTLIGGDSGGPLFDLDGKVIGVHSRIGAPLHVNLHVPVGVYQRQWDRLAAGEAWGRTPGVTPFIGVRGEAEAEMAKISEVIQDAPAEKAGVRPGDVITKFDGQAVTDFASLKKMVDNRQPGDRVQLEVKRGERTLRLELEIGNRPN